jgi:hypothetical protein
MLRETLSVHHIPRACAMLLRMCLCLKAVATAVGLPDVSPRARLVPHATVWLRSRGLGVRDLTAASLGRDWSRVSPTVSSLA